MGSTVSRSTTPRGWHYNAGTPAGPEIPLSRSQTHVPKMTELASGAITAVDTVTIELGEADEPPAIIIVGWPAKPTLFHPCRSV